MIKINNGNVEIEGIKKDILVDLAALVESLFESGFSKEQIEYAVRLGLMSQEERKEELKRQENRMKELKELEKDIMSRLENIIADIKGGKNNAF